MNLHEDAESNVVTATFELPGLTKDKVNIDVHNGCLTISGEVAESSERNQDGYKIKERRSGKFSRTLQLPDGTQVTILIRTPFHNGGAEFGFCSLTPLRLPWKMVC